MSDDAPPLCPSVEPAAGALLLGLVRADGTVGFLGTPLAIDEEFVARAGEGRNPSARFRAAGPCVEHDCRHWTPDGACGVARAAVADLSDAAQAADATPPRCGIRPRCRWFAQEGATACRTCVFVIRETATETAAVTTPACPAGP